MNSKFDRKYFVLRTMGGDAIGLASIIVPSNDIGLFEFSLHHPSNRDKPNEFTDLTYTEMDFAEFETHRDVFETYGEVEIVKEWVPRGVGDSVHVLVKKPDAAS
jgi:hypothetical protein